MILLREFPGKLGATGMALIVAGSYFMVDQRVTEPRRNVFARFFSERGVQYRFGALILSAVEAVFLKRALLASSPLITFVFWSVLGCGVSGSALLVTKADRLPYEFRVFRAGHRAYLLLFITTGLMQLCTLLTFAAFHVGYALALFQTSTLLSVFLGYKVFREKNFVERLIGSGIMAGGAVLIVMSR
jgi:drug/metabolite transporter (DMT)-like permease